MARILLIDDSLSLRRMARRALEEVGHDVVEAEDGNTALRLFAGLQPDLVVSDVFMPGMNGIELFIRIREAFPEVRLIMVSGGGSIEQSGVLEASSSLGAVGTLDKPFTAEALQECVRRALEHPPAGPPTEGGHG